MTDTTIGKIEYDPPKPIDRAHMYVDRIFKYGSADARENALLYLRLLTLLNQLEHTEENRATIVDVMNKVTAHLVARVIMPWESK